MSQPASRVSTNLLHTHTHTRRLRPIHTFAPIYTHTHFLSSPVTINVILLLLTFELFCFPSLSVTLSAQFASSPPTYHHFSFCSFSTPVLFHLAVTTNSPPLSFPPCSSSPLCLSFLVSAPSTFAPFSPFFLYTSFSISCWK